MQISNSTPNLPKHSRGTTSNTLLLSHPQGIRLRNFPNKWGGVKARSTHADFPRISVAVATLSIKALENDALQNDTNEQSTFSSTHLNESATRKTTHLIGKERTATSGESTNMTSLFVNGKDPYEEYRHDCASTTLTTHFSLKELFEVRYGGDTTF
jgi:hypothetical protein